MPNRTRGSWTAADTRSVLLAAAQLAKQRASEKGVSQVAVEDVLKSANSIWRARYSEQHGDRFFTRGAIMSNWPSTRTFLDEALHQTYDFQDVLPWPPFADLERGVKSAKRYSSLEGRRLETKLSVGSMVYTAIVNGADPQWWSCWFDLQAKRADPAIQDLIARAWTRRLELTTKNCRDLVRIAHLAIPPADLAQALLALIDGGIFEAELGPVRDLHHFASIAQDSAVAILQSSAEGESAPKLPPVEATQRTRTRTRRTPDR